MAAKIRDIQLIPSFFSVFFSQLYATYATICDKSPQSPQFLSRITQKIPRSVLSRRFA